MQKFPKVLLQWEDFSKNNATRLLERYRDRLCTFNDDIQGTGAVTLAGLLAAAKVTGTTLGKQRIVRLGAGSLGTGISDQIAAAMKREGLSDAEAHAALWLVDSRGLVHSGRTDLEPFKQKYAQRIESLANWTSEARDHFTFEDVIRNVKPTVLARNVGTTGSLQ